MSDIFTSLLHSTIIIMYCIGRYVLQMEDAEWRQTLKALCSTKFVHVQKRLSQMADASLSVYVHMVSIIPAYNFRQVQKPQPQHTVTHTYKVITRRSMP